MVLRHWMKRSQQFRRAARGSSAPAGVLQYSRVLLVTPKLSYNKFTMKHTFRVLAFCTAVVLSHPVASLAQPVHWVPYAEMPGRVSAIEILDDTRTLVATFQFTPGIIWPTLHLLHQDRIIWSVTLDTTELPYFDYPHGVLQDILPVS